VSPPPLAVRVPPELIVTELADCAPFNEMLCPERIITISSASGILSTSLPTSVQLPGAFQLPVATLDVKVLTCEKPVKLVKRNNTIIRYRLKVFMLNMVSTSFFNLGSLSFDEKQPRATQDDLKVKMKG
jgi:hypothetical protein